MLYFIHTGILQDKFNSWIININSFFIVNRISSGRNYWKWHVLGILAIFWVIHLTIIFIVHIRDTLLVNLPTPVLSTHDHDWPSTNLEKLHKTWQHTTELHTTQWLSGVLVRMCVPYPNRNSGRSNVGPTYIACWLVRLWRGLPRRVTHTTEPAHHRASGACNVLSPVMVYAVTDLHMITINIKAYEV